MFARRTVQHRQATAAKSQSTRRANLSTVRFVPPAFVWPSSYPELNTANNINEGSNDVDQFGGNLWENEKQTNETGSQSLVQLQAAKAPSTGDKTIKIGLIPADGIGKEVVPEGRRVLETLAQVNPKLKFDFIDLDAGWGTFQRIGLSLPPATVAELRNCEGALFGAVSSPSHKVAGYSSPIVQMRKDLDLFANLRPCASIPLKTPGGRDNVDMLIVRENTEDLYVKREKKFHDEKLGQVAIAEKQISEKASLRIARTAFQQATTRAHVTEHTRKVTIVHKSNVLSVSDGLFRECCQAVAKEFPEIKVEEQIVDSMMLKMIQHPEAYDVIVAPNLYGDILSDAAAAFVGGLGMAPSANMGDTFVLGEPVHGSAPDIEGKGIANPMATIRSVALMLETLRGGEFSVYSGAINQAVTKVLKEGKTVTPDLGGRATTKQVTDAVLAELLKSLHK